MRRPTAQWTGVLVLVALCICLAQAQQAKAMDVAAAEIGKSVVNRELVDPGTSFPVTVGKLYCFSKIANISAASQITHVWYYGDTERARISLSVNPPSWRTYSSKIIQAHEIGAWRVEILDASGTLLQTVSFQTTQ
jgi:Protein of unknown function (DUF2914)